MNSDATYQSLSRPVAKWRAATWILASTLVIVLGSCVVLLALGWRFYRVERPDPGGLTTAGQSASVEKWSPPLGPGESTVSRFKRLGNQLAALSIASTNRPDPGKVLAEAKDLAGKGRYEEALQRHIWYHNHALEYDPGQSGVRLSFALSDWIDLGRKFPKAKQALVEIRDREEHEFAQGGGDFALFLELSSIDRSLQAQEDTVAVFKSILNQDSDLAKQCYLIVENLLVEKQEYAICLSFIPDAQGRFNSIQGQLEQMKPRIRYATPQLEVALQKASTDGFVTQVRNLVEILVASGRKPEAERICSQAAAVLDDPRLSSAIADAEKRVAK